MDDRCPRARSRATVDRWRSTSPWTRARSLGTCKARLRGRTLARDRAPCRARQCARAVVLRSRARGIGVERATSPTGCIPRFAQAWCSRPRRPRRRSRRRRANDSAVSATAVTRNAAPTARARHRPTESEWRRRRAHERVPRPFGDDEPIGETPETGLVGAPASSRRAQFAAMTWARPRSLCAVLEQRDAASRHSTTTRKARRAARRPPRELFRHLVRSATARARVDRPCRAKREHRRPRPRDDGEDPRERAGGFA